jgi:hypothetical protein
MRLLVVLALVFGVASCKPLYGGKAEKLASPPKKKRPDKSDAPPPEIKYVEECTANFTDDPKKVHPQTAISRTLFNEGESALAESGDAKDDQVMVTSLTKAIDKYRNALIKDPYNVPATLKLAVAYDRAQRKGCAIAMLKRLAALSNHPKWADEANRNIESINTNAGWFKGYRKDAMAAVGR